MYKDAKMNDEIKNSSFRAITHVLKPYIDSSTNNNQTF